MELFSFISKWANLLFKVILSATSVEIFAAQSFSQSAIVPNTKNNPMDNTFDEFLWFIDGTTEKVCTFLKPVSLKLIV